MTSRRSVMQGLTGLGVVAALGEAGFGDDALAAAAAARPAAEPGLSEAAASGAEWIQVPGKVALIKRTYRPPNYETPLEYFRTPITPNKAFFVRYHHARLPSIRPRDWSLRIAGPAAERSVSLNLAQLRKDFASHELTALCLCAGNRRGLFSAHVIGVQWGSGAMGNAHWRGVRLHDVLDRAGVHSDAIEVAFAGDDEPMLPESPDYQKSLPISKALHPDTMIAYEMNGEALPALHGSPARLIVPGWTATYWIKHLSSIEIRTTPFENFWIKTGYRVPAGKFPWMERFATQETTATTPITQIAVNSLITSPAQNAQFPRTRPVTLTGQCWDSGSGIERLEISFNEGGHWEAARLGADLGGYSLRPWSYTVAPGRPAGPLSVRVRASSRAGLTQPLEATPNPSGYHHNAIQKLNLVLA